MKKNHLLPFLAMLGFLLGIHNGRVALWKSPDPEPYRVFPCYVSTLPPEIRTALEKGIKIESEADLDRLLESLCS